MLELGEQIPRSLLSVKKAFFSSAQACLSATAQQAHTVRGSTKTEFRTKKNGCLEKYPVDLTNSDY